MEILISAVVQLTVIFSFSCAAAGLVLGSLMSNRRPIQDLNSTLFLLGGAAAIISASIIAFADLAPIGFEVEGVMLGLSLFLTFMGVGLLINPYKQT